MTDEGYKKAGQQVEKRKQRCNWCCIICLNFDKVIQHFLLETDSPYLTPVPYRGKQNSPSHIIDIANFVKDIYGVSLDELSKITNENAYSLFDKLN